MDVKVGQVWKYRDKRRNTVIEIIEMNEGHEAIGLIVGTEDERAYKVDRLVKRWDLVRETPETTDSIYEWDGTGSYKYLPHAHIHMKGMCVQNNTDVPCDLPKPQVAVWVNGDDYTTREQWLEAAAKSLVHRLFKPHDIDVPAFRVSVGWPGGRGSKKNVVGQCFPALAAKDKRAQVFISPVLDDAVEVVTTLAHEMIHAIAVDENGVGAGHRGEFIRIGREIGFLPPWKSTPPSEDLLDLITRIATTLGEYPHSAISIAERPKVQKTYYRKVACPSDPEYFLRITQTKLDDFGYPICPCHGEVMEDA